MMKKKLSNSNIFTNINFIDNGLLCLKDGSYAKFFRVNPIDLSLTNKEEQELFYFTLSQVYKLKFPIKAYKYDEKINLNSNKVYYDKLLHNAKTNIQKDILNNNKEFIDVIESENLTYASSYFFAIIGKTVEELKNNITEFERLCNSTNPKLYIKQIDNKKELIFLRYYLICGNYIYLSYNNFSNYNRGKLDTPFFLKSDSHKVTLEESTNIIKDLSGIENGEIRFFYGRKSQRPRRNKMFRYFYFLKGDINEYNIIKDGKWFNYDEIKEIYSSEPDKLSNILIADTTRIARILITEKVYDSYGNRKIALDNYVPTYDLYDLYNSDIDFQDDKWIRISLFNSDSKFYKIRKLFRQIFRNRQNRNTPPTSHEA